ncbi:MAG TPA: tRNA (guanosine(46)-N7)-methyltransferase TrmB [Phycisphaerales bacterium]|nr:tRNA (guanosine(46)-N7)-methyltransferase TrmB [Phycisphaerales bacterium]
MSFGLSRGRTLDPSPIAVTPAELPPLPDDAARRPEAGRVDVHAWFGPERRGLPLEIEIGSGKGTFLVREAARRPETNFLGVEWAGEFFLYAADRVRRAGLGNVRMLRTDATEFIRWRVPEARVRVIHLYFSDPWPKRRHHKNRVVQDAFLAEAHRVLEPGGELRLVTDHDELWAWYQDHFARWAPPAGPGAPGPGTAPAPFELRPFEAPPGTGEEGELVGTNFERKFRREGRTFHAAVLRKPG